MNDTIYIFGHKKPDTDSVCSSIALSYLKNELGYNTEARILSSINLETKYVLKQFGFKVPDILEDVKLQVKDINYHKGFLINTNSSVYDAFFTMQENDMSTIPLTNDSGQFIGTFAMKDIAKTEILECSDRLKTNYDHILKVIEGKEILRFNNEIDGKIKKEILISDTNVMINNILKLIIICNDNELNNEILEECKAKKINVIYTSLTLFECDNKITFANYIDGFRYTKDLVCAREYDELNDLYDIINKTKHSYYPVIDNKNNCLGLIKLSDLRDSNPKKVILVDHNELSQSVDGLDEAQVIEIVDHHKLGNLGTLEPINFRNSTVGSTCTIVYDLYKENKVKIPENIASLLLAGIISDTLLLKSPTTTEKDKLVLDELVKITNIDTKKLANSMFKANDIINSKSMKEIVYMDFKTFNVDNKVIAVGQVNTLNAKAILKQKNSYVNFLNKEADNNHFDVLILDIIDITKNGSYLLFNNKALHIMKMAFDEKIDQGDFVEGLISRKKQLIPKIMNYLK